jgi:hypothetical protein
VQIGGNPDLAVETSDATQAEINARIFKGERRIRELSFRVDGSYTRINQLIQVASGNSGNSGDRRMTSLEFFGKLYLQDGHRLEFGYLRGDTSDKGRLRSLPENWFSLAGVWSLFGSKITATTMFKITGAAETPNRLVEHRGNTYSITPSPGRWGRRTRRPWPRPIWCSTGCADRGPDARRPLLAYPKLAIRASPTTHCSATATSRTFSMTTSRTWSIAQPMKASEPTWP